MDQRNVGTSPQAALVHVSREIPNVLLLTLNRPRQRNALNNAMIAELGALFEQASNEDTIRCVVLTGGHDFFAAGADLKEMHEQGFSAIDNSTRRTAWRAIERFPKPLIAAVEGYAFGGGCELAMLSDIVIAGRGARFAQPEIKLGILPGDGATQRLTRIVGKPLAMRMILTGEPIDAATALTAGLISDIVEDGTVLECALEMARTIAGNPPAAARLAKEAVLSSYETMLSAGLDVERAAIRLAFTTADQKEGMDAFLARRTPVFTGR